MNWNFKRFLDEISFLGDILDDRLKRLAEKTDLTPLISTLDRGKAISDIVELFGPGEFEVLGIDGSMDYRDRLEVLILYISISGYKCPLTVKDESIEINIDDSSRSDRYTTSAIIPLWLEDLNEVLHKSNIGISRSIDKALEGIPFSIMTFGEFYMGYKASREDDEVKVILYDRPFASSIHPFQRDLRRLIFDEGCGSLVRIDINGERITPADLLLGLYIGPNIYRLPNRPPYRMYSILQYIINNGGEANLHEVEREFKVDREKLLKWLKRLDTEKLENTLLEESQFNYIKLRDERLNYWSKIVKLIEMIADRIYGESDAIHPLYLGDGVWLGSRELNSITLFTIYDTIKYSLKNNKLIIGIGKDTYVTDIYRSIVPVARWLGVIKDVEIPIKSDKPLLTMLSSLQPERFPTPWRLKAYDGAFATTVDTGREDIPLKAARKVIFQEGLIVRTYFQLRTIRSIDNTLVRSPVFFYDRFIHPEYDMGNIKRIPVLLSSGEAFIDAYIEEDLSRIDNMILYILSMMDKSEVAEVTGHNYLLFLADKDAKKSIAVIRDSVIDAVDAKISQIIRQKGLFIITRRFRDYRYIVEKRRGR